MFFTSKSRTATVKCQVAMRREFAACHGNVGTCEEEGERFLTLKAALISHTDTNL